MLEGKGRIERNNIGEEERREIRNKIRIEGKRQEESSSKG
jgi:hypothetical protein